MPSRRCAGTDHMDWSDEDSNDPDYRESSDDSDADDLPQSMHRDRAQWIVDHTDTIADLLRILRVDGEHVFGRAFLQTCSINSFANFVYKYTMPGAHT